MRGREIREGECRTIITIKKSPHVAIYVVLITYVCLLRKAQNINNTHAHTLLITL